LTLFWVTKALVTHLRVAMFERRTCQPISRDGFARAAGLLSNPLLPSWIGPKGRNRHDLRRLDADGATALADEPRLDRFKRGPTRKALEVRWQQEAVSAACAIGSEAQPMIEELIDQNGPSVWILQWRLSAFLFIHRGIFAFRQFERKPLTRLRRSDSLKSHKRLNGKQ
jgi:hypothetical protein